MRFITRSRNVCCTAVLTSTRYSIPPGTRLHPSSLHHEVHHQVQECLLHGCPHLHQVGILILGSTISLCILMTHLLVIWVAKMKAAKVDTTMSLHPPIRTPVQGMCLAKDQGEHS